MPLASLRRLFRSSDTEKDAPKKVKTKRVLQAPLFHGNEKLFKDEEVDDATAEVAADLLAKPLMGPRYMIPRDMKQMAEDEGYINLTDTGARRKADKQDAEEAKRGSSQRLVRTGYGGGIKTGDGGDLKFGSDDPQAMMGMKKGGKVKSGASSRGDGIATRGKTKGRFV